MKEKNYVVILGPIRKDLCSMNSGRAIVESYSCRTGDLGLIHPSIVSFWENFHKNYFGRGKGAKFFSATGSGSFLYNHEKDDVPVLVYNGHLLNCGSPPHPQRKREYFLVPLKKTEFVELAGTSLGEVRDELKEIYNNRGMKVFCYPIGIGSPEKALEKTVEEQWKRLALFNPNRDLICKIPIEVSERDISNETIYMQEQLNKTLNEFEQWRRKSLRSNFVFDYCS